MGRAPCCDKASVKKGPWSPEEDAELKAYIEEHGTGGNWIALPHKIGLKRCGKSCRLRWLNYLRPNIKHGGFSEEEDRIIFSLYTSIGSRWSIIAAQLPGRTDNDIKNYWNTRLKKKFLGKQQPRELDHHSLQPQCRRPPADQPATEPTAAAANAASHETLSASALERMQLQLQIQGLHSAANFFSDHPMTAPWPKISDAAAEPPSLPMQQYARRDHSSSLLHIGGQEDQDHALGFSPSSSGGGGGLVGCSDYNSPVTGLQSSTTSSEGNQMHTDPDCGLGELMYYNGDHHQKGVSTGWWSSNNAGFEEKAALMDGYSVSSSLQLDSLMFQDQFVSGCDL